MCPVVAVGGNYRDMFLYDDDPVCFNVSFVTFVGVYLLDVDYPDFIIRLLDWNVVLDGSGVFHRYHLWGHPSSWPFALVTFIRWSFACLCGW